MARYTLHQVDNRDASQMYEYLEARIEAMKRRISELEIENQSMTRRSRMRMTGTLIVNNVIENSEANFARTSSVGVMEL